MFYIPFRRKFYAEFKYDISFSFWVYLDPHSGFCRGMYGPKKNEFLKNDIIYLIWVSFCKSQRADSEYIYFLSFRASFREILRIFRGTRKLPESHDIFLTEARN